MKNIRILSLKPTGRKIEMKNNMIILKKTLMALALTVLLNGAAQAMPVTVKFTAQVTEAYGTSDWTPGSTDIVAGTQFTGTYTYDTDAVDSNASPNIADFYYTNGGGSIQFNIGNHTFATDMINPSCIMELVNDYYGQDNFCFISYNNVIDGVTYPSPYDPNSSVIIDLQFDDFTQTALSSASMPTTALVPANWTQDYGLNVQTPDFFVRAKLTSLTIENSTPTPPPADGDDNENHGDKGKGKKKGHYKKA